MTDQSLSFTDNSHFKTHISFVNIKKALDIFPLFFLVTFVTLGRIVAKIYC